MTAHTTWRLKTWYGLLPARRLGGGGRRQHHHQPEHHEQRRRRRRGRRTPPGPGPAGRPRQPGRSVAATRRRRRRSAAHVDARARRHRDRAPAGGGRRPSRCGGACDRTRSCGGRSSERRRRSAAWRRTHRRSGHQRPPWPGTCVNLMSGPPAVRRGGRGPAAGSRLRLPVPAVGVPVEAGAPRRQHHDVAAAGELTARSTASDIDVTVDVGRGPANTAAMSSAPRRWRRPLGSVGARRPSALGRGPCSAHRRSARVVEGPDRPTQRGAWSPWIVVPAHAVGLADELDAVGRADEGREGGGDRGPPTRPGSSTRAAAARPLVRSWGRPRPR